MRFKFFFRRRYLRRFRYFGDFGISRDLRHLRFAFFRNYCFIPRCLRDLHAAAGQGHRRAALALDVFCYGVRKMIAGYAAAMGGVDTVVFTAGVGENSADTRARILRGLEFMGITCDEEKNRFSGEERIISRDGAPVTVMVVPTNEELMIAQDTFALVAQEKSA